MDLVSTRNVCGCGYRGVTGGTPRGNRIGCSEDVAGQRHPCMQVVFTSVSPHVGRHHPGPFTVEAKQVASRACIAVAICYSCTAERSQRAEHRALLPAEKPS